MRRIAFFLLLVPALLLFPRAAAEEAVEIGTFEELAAFSARVARGEATDARVRLTADITATRPLRAR